MNDKLRFKDEAPRDEITEKPEESVNTVKNPKRKNQKRFLPDDTLPDRETTVDNPVAKHDGGEKTPIYDVFDDEADISDELKDPADTVQTKLYERESSLNFTKDNTDTPVNPTKKPVKKRQSVFDFMDDTTSHDNLFDKPIIPVESTDDHIDNAEKSETNPDIDGETPKNEETPKTDISESEPVNSDVADTSDVPVKSENPDKKKLDSENKLKFNKDKQTATKSDKKISSLEHKRDNYIEQRDKARDKQPSKKKKVRERYFDESKNKVQTKIRFDKDPIPINEAKWNLPKKQSLPVKGVTAITATGINKLHTKVYEAEHENVGTQTAHQAELVGESAYRGSKKLIHETNRHIKNAPYRKAAKFETKSIKTNMKLDYQKALKDNPKLKSSPLSRFMQKQKIKRQYAEAIRKAKKSGETVKKTGSVVTKITQTVVRIIRRNPVFFLMAGLLLIMLFVIMAMLTTCMGMFSNTTAVFGAACYAADDADIDKAELLYTELETDLALEISNAETTHSGYDEYRYNVGNIGHDPHELMAFLTAVYNDFKYDDIESVLREIFDGQYNLEFVPETEIRTKTETRTETTTDDDGNEVESEYEEEVEYEWYVLNINLTSVSLMSIILPRMNSDQTEHFFILMQTKGGRQYAGNPFNINWIPYVTSNYGYRIHPITGVKDYHKGTDIGLPAGTPIHAGITGTVTAADYDDEYGNYIVISDGNGLEMKYAHCDTLSFSAGQTVTKGDIIATVGNTGTSTGAHLHMEIVKDGIYMNPVYFVESN